MSKKSITLVGLTTAAGALAGTATLMGFLGRFWWGFELATHFRVQYAIALGVGALILLLYRRQRWAAILMILALVNMLILAPRFFQPAAVQPDADGPVFRALLANINSNNHDYSRIRDVLLKQDADFVLLLEVTPWLLDRLTDMAERYPHRIAAPREDNFGIALLSRRPFLQAQIVQLSAMGLPSIVAEFLDEQRHFTVVGTHPLPPVGPEQAKDRNAQLAKLAELARQTRPPLLVLGDLNLSPWSPYFEQLLTDSGLRDSGRGYGILPSWPVDWPPLWIAIDHALFSAGIQVQRRETGPDLGSDHYPVIVDFRVKRS